MKEKQYLLMMPRDDARAREDVLRKISERETTPRIYTRVHIHI